MNLRSAMPNTAAWIDFMRETFGKDCIDAAIRDGMKGSTAFYASENGQEIGCKASGEGIALSECVVGLPGDPAAFGRANKPRGRV